MTVGTFVTIGPVAQPGTGTDDTAGTLFLPGLAARGNTAKATLVRSYAEFERLFGKRPGFGWLHDIVMSYFGEGDPSASRVYIIRLVGPGATKGTITAPDRTAGTPINTIRFDARDAGQYSSDVQVVVKTGTINNTVDIAVNYGGENVENFYGLDSPATIQAKMTASDYVRAVNLSASSTGVTALPQAGNYTLSAGNDDRNNVTAQAYLAAVNTYFGEDLGPGLIGVPGQVYSVVASQLGAHAGPTRRQVVVEPAQGTTPTAAGNAAQSLRNDPNAWKMMMPYPWVTVADGAGGYRTIPALGAVAGVRARRRGRVWEAPAGEAGTFRFVNGVERALSADEVQTLTASGVSVIRGSEPGNVSAFSSSSRLYGYRTLSADVLNWKFMTWVDLVDWVAWQLDTRLEKFTFALVDDKGRLYSKMRTEITDILDPIASAGGLYAMNQERAAARGVTPDPGYAISFSLTTDDALQTGEVDVNVGIRPAPIAELIRVGLSKVTITTAF